MNAVLIGARILLTAVFAVAALSKLADMSGSREALEGFGVPARLSSPAAVGLPLLELATAALLVVAPLAQAGAAVAAAVLILFIFGIVRALQRGLTPNCHCFGQLHSRPAGRETLARNGTLAVAAVFVVAAGPGPGITNWFSQSRGTVVALVVLSVCATFLFYAGLSLWSRNRELTGRGPASQSPAALRVGQAVPHVVLETTEGTRVGVFELLDDESRHTILVFTSATCVPCAELLPELARWRETLFGKLGIHVVAAGDVEQNRRLGGQHVMPMLLDSDGSAARSFGVQATPSAIEVDANGRVAAAPAVGAPAIEAMIRAGLDRLSRPAELEVRHVSPSLGSPPAGASA